jgi:hypothetical protein
MGKDLIVLVSRPYTNVPPLKVWLQTDVGFDGTGTLTRSGGANIDFTIEGTRAALKFDGADNKFLGAKLSAGFNLIATAKSPSAKVNDVLLTLTLSGGSKIIGPPAKIRFTAIQVTLDICEPRLDDKVDPIPLPTANVVPPPGSNPIDKFHLGRPLPVQTNPKIDERAMLIVRDVQPKDFVGNLELSLDAADNGQIKIFKTERPLEKQDPVDMPMPVSPKRVIGPGFKLFVEGAKASPNVRATGVRLGIKGLAGDLDYVKVTVCHTEIVSNRKLSDIKLVASVAEKPARATKSAFIVAPIIVGLEYPVEMRPYIELATPSAYKWVTASDKVNLKDVGKEVVGLTAKKLSGKINDVLLDLFLTTNMGKLKKRHLMTSVHVEIDPISSGDWVKHDDPLNLIKNPSGCVILAGGDAADVKLVPRYEISKIQPDLKWKEDDERIAWWILGGDAKASNQYDGKADFMNTDAAKRGTKIQVYGVAEGDVLIQPYSGGYGYGMIRAHVVPIRQVKYRISRIFTTAQAAQPARPAQAPLPAQAAVPAFAGGGGVPALPAVPALAAVPALPAVPAVPARAAHAPSASHAESALHMKVANIFLRQMGIEMIPDDSAEMARPVAVASPALPAVAAQPAIAAQAAVPAFGAFPARPAVAPRPAVNARPAVAAVAASAANPKVGLAALDGKVVNVTSVSPGHFDVEVSDAQLTFNSKVNQIPAIQINARNEVISVAYIEQDPTFGTGVVTLSTALRCPANHAPKTRARQPEAYAAANFTLTDLGTPSTSLIPKSGIPPDIPSGSVKMVVLFPDVTWQGASPVTRDVNLLWGIIVPTRNMDSAVGAPITVDKRRHMYGFVFAHEMGHILGLGHRGAVADPVTDTVAIPADKNIMRPFVNPPVTENFDIIQTKAIRFSEVMSRTP